MIHICLFWLKLLFNTIRDFELKLCRYYNLIIIIDKLLMSKYNTKVLQNMNKQIEKMTKSEHIQVLTLIKQDDKVKITENNNGCFVNLNELSDETIESLDKFLKYSQTKEKELKNIEKETCKMENLFS